VRDIGVRDPRGRRDHDFVARIERGHQDVVQDLLAARARGNVLGLELEAVLAFELIDDRGL
jgi:hypothetical protein